MFEGDLLNERARITPDKLALVSVETGERLTYGQLNDRVDLAAAAIAVAPGDRFGILAHNSINFITHFFAAARTGAIAVPLSTRATSHELEAIIRDCDMKLLFVDEDHSHRQTLIPEQRFGETLSGFFAGRRSAEIPASDDAIAALLYTSGTTGRPKGVMIPRRQLLWNGYNTALNWGLREDDVSSIFTPLYHAGGLAAFLIPIFCAGGTIILHKTFQPAEVLGTIEREGCTVVLGVPTIWKMLMDAPEFATVSFDRVRWFISGGAPLPLYISEAYERRGVVLRQGYGMTEVGVNCFTMTDEQAAAKRGSIGTPMMFTNVRIVGENGNEVQPGEVGEMYIRGPHVSSGYWNNEAETKQAYLDDGWFRTGDLARRDGDGFFFIAGRRKEMFISGGVNVYPAEIEAQLVLHPSVTDAAVIAVPDETWGEAGIAFVVAGGVSEDELSAYLTERIAKFKLPKRFIFLDALPRSPYGKVEKIRLREKLA